MVGMTSPKITLPTIALLGAGSMGRAIIAGLLSPDVHVEGGVRLTNRTAREDEFAGDARVTRLVVAETLDANRLAVAGASVVIIGVKPAMVADLLDDIADALAPDALIVSVAAGVTTRTMEAHLPAGQPVVRTMPNTPATVGRGVTGLTVGTRTTPEDLALAVQLFETVGDVLVVEEEAMDALGSISGSGPAYVFYFIEKLIETAIDKGFTREQADLMVRGTFTGALELLRKSGEQPAELRRRVTSPGGSTERAIAAFDDADIRGILDAATDAAVARQREMGRA